MRRYDCYVVVPGSSHPIRIVTDAVNEDAARKNAKDFCKLRYGSTVAKSLTEWQHGDYAWYVSTCSVTEAITFEVIE